MVGYGDDSVAELGGAHIACEDVSMIAAKTLENFRIGLSPLEKSTRYVWFNQKVNGKYRYYRDPEIMSSEFSELYEQTCDMLFDTYSKLVEPMKAFLIKRFPKDQDTSERAYAFTIRCKACDILRGLLPASTFTNVGIFGNGRALEYVITKMNSSELSEIKILADSMDQELSKIIPSFVKRANNVYGKQQQAFFSETKKAMDLEAQKLGLGKKENQNQESERLILVDYDHNSENRIIAGMLYPSSNMSFAVLLQTVKNMDPVKKKEIINEYMSRRQNRRNRPDRAAELGYYLFDILGNFGTYRDLQRHRVLTQERQLLTTENGYDTPKEIEEAGFIKEYNECMHSAHQAWEKISKKFPLQAQYVVPLGFRVRWYFWLNLREAYHLCELRTTQQGHPDYRKICQNIYTMIRDVHPALAEHMRFVDMKSYDLERIESEKRLDKKIDELKKKYS